VTFSTDDRPGLHGEPFAAHGRVFAGVVPLTYYLRMARGIAVKVLGLACSRPQVLERQILERQILER